MAVWTTAQTAQFLTVSASRRLHAAHHLIALRGLCRGEASGLRWCNVNLDASTLRVRSVALAAMALVCRRGWCLGDWCFRGLPGVWCPVVPG
jgi:hypothetical protein